MRDADIYVYITAQAPTRSLKAVTSCLRVGFALIYHLSFLDMEHGVQVKWQDKPIIKNVVLVWRITLGLEVTASSMLN